MGTKACRKCGAEKPFDQFYRSGQSKDGLQSWCKECCCESARNWSRANRAKANETDWERRTRKRGRPPRAVSNVVERDGVTYKRCKACEQEKLPDEFHRSTAGALGRQSVCKPCAVAAAMQWGKDNPEKLRRNQLKARLKKKYGLTPEMVDALMDRQQGKCAVCRDELVPSATHIDHCHVEGQVRGLLCRACNTGLGLFKDDEKRLLAAVRYLRAARRQPAA